MKNLKKVTAGFLSLSLLTCVGATQAFADSGSKTITTTNSTEEISKAKVGDIKTAEDTYNVEIAWGDLQYDYVEKWDGTKYKSTHEWERHTKESTSASIKASDQITITNKSNVAIQAAFEFTQTTGEKDYSEVIDEYYSDPDYTARLTSGNNKALTLDAASNGSTHDDNVYMKLIGEPTSVVPAIGDTIGTVTVTVSKRADS